MLGISRGIVLNFDKSMTHARLGLYMRMKQPIGSFKQSNCSQELVFFEDFACEEKSYKFGRNVRRGLWKA